MVVPKRGSIDQTEYRMELIELQQGLCPITMRELDSKDGEVLFVHGNDYFVSSLGLVFLCQRFGNEYIKSHIPDEDYEVDPNDEYYGMD
jgi:hypothetical protein